MNQINIPDGSVKSIEELKNFLGNFSGEIDKLRDKIQNGDLPPFRIPNWPEKMDAINVILTKREFLFPSIIENNAPLNELLRLKKITANVEIMIEKNGIIGISVYEEHRKWFLKKEKLNYRWRGGPYFSYYEICRSDNDYSPMIRMCCFIIFSQFLEEICADIIKQLKKKLARLKSAVNEYELIIEAVKKSFEPLIPFMVVDALSEK